MGTTERRQRHKAELRQEIMDAARELFARDGFDRVTMRRVAERIEYSPTTIYLYFENKTELFNAICEETFAKLSRQLARLREKTPDPLEYLREGLTLYIDFALKHEQHYRLTFLDAPKDPSDYAFQGSAGQRAFMLLHQAVREAVDQGRIRPVDVDTTAQALWTSVHGVAAALIAMKGFPFVDRRTLVGFTVDTLLRGLQP